MVGCRKIKYHAHFSKFGSEIAYLGVFRPRGLFQVMLLTYLAGVFIKKK